MAQDSGDMPLERTYKARSGLFSMLDDLARDVEKFQAWKTSEAHRDEIMSDYGLTDRQQELMREGWGNEEEGGSEEAFWEAIRDETINRFNDPSFIRLQFC